MVEETIQEDNPHSLQTNTIAMKRSIIILHKVNNGKSTIAGRKLSNFFKTLETDIEKSNHYTERRISSFFLCPKKFH